MNLKMKEKTPLKRSFFGEFRKYFEEYCSCTSIHGFRYFGENRTIFEKIWWFFIFISTLATCVYVIFLIYEKWSKSPLIVSLATENTPIYQIPFPAVTVCPSIKYSHKCLNFKDVLERKFNEQHVDYEEQKMFEYVFPFCIFRHEFFFEYQEENSENVEEKLVSFPNETITDEIFDKLLNCSPFLNDSFFFINFMGKFMDFHDVFSPIMTDEGICFTFNMLKPRDIYEDDVYVNSGFDFETPSSTWISQEGFSEDAELLTYPRRALFSGAGNSLEFMILHDEKDNDCFGAEKGYKVILHMPTRIPMPKMESLMVPFNKVTSISVVSRMMTTSEMVKKYVPEQRNCYFEHEKKLKFFKKYSSINCNIECVANYTLKKCGCVPFYMPRFNSTPICGLARFSCVNKARDVFNFAKLSHKLQRDRYRKMDKDYIYSYDTYEKSRKIPKRTKRNTNFDEELNDCNCFKMCNDIDFIGTVASLNHNWNDVTEKNSSEDNDFGFTHIKIYFQSNGAFTLERNELYGPTDFLSNFGGLLGLFTGFSILSLMEIVYFCTLRIIGNLKIFGKWYGEKLYKNQCEINKEV